MSLSGSLSFLKSGVGGTISTILKHNMKLRAILPPLQNDPSNHAISPALLSISHEHSIIAEIVFTILPQISSYCAPSGALFSLSETTEHA